MKILHSADWHLDSPLQGRSALLKQALLALPGRITALARAERCDLMLLSGDLFDGPCSAESLSAVRSALEEVQIPVCIAPGNHDYVGTNAPWLSAWPENVHIFTGSMDSIVIESLDCCVYGAAFQGPESKGLLEGFRAECTQRYAVGVLHGDPTQLTSPHGPITHGQVQESGLSYLALGHIHKGGAFRAGDTLCAWPGCPMGRGFDETGDKGVLIVTLDDGCEARFVPLDVPKFHWLKTELSGLPDLLPGAGSEDLYRIDLVGECDPPDLEALYRKYAQFPNLELRDRTVPPLDLWVGAGSDTLEGVYFGLLKQSDADPEVVRLAARISRQILLGQEVAL